MVKQMTHNPDHELSSAAMRADRTIGPEPGFNEFVGGGLVVEVLVGKNGFHDDSPCAATITERLKR